jgi:hypothetical protein
MNKREAGSYVRKLKECRLDPVADPLIAGISLPHPFSRGFSTGEVLEKALAWQQELAARVREELEQPGIPLEERTKSAQLLVSLAAEAAMTVKALAVVFPDVFKAVASKKGTFPINIPAHPEERDNIIRWLTETLQLDSEGEFKSRGRKTFSRKTPANRLLLHYISRIKAAANERARLCSQEKLTPLSKATAGQWMKVIWKLLLADCPEPEKHEWLKQFGAYKAKKTHAALGKSSPKSEAANARAGIQDALLRYLRRMLSDK